MAEGAQCWFGGVDMIKGAEQKVVKRRVGMLGFNSGFEELAAIRGEQSGRVLAAESLTPLVNDDFPQRVELTGSCAGKSDFAAEKKIQLSGKRAFRTPRPFCYGFDESVIGGEPVNDQAGFREASQPGDDGLSGLHGGSVALIWEDFHEIEGNISIDNEIETQ